MTATRPDGHHLHQAVLDMLTLVAQRFAAPMALREAVHAGLLLRVHEIMGAVAALARHEPSTSVRQALSRMLIETAVDIEYLCLHGSDDHYRQFALGGLKTEYELIADVEERAARDPNDVTALEVSTAESARERICAEFPISEIAAASRSWGPSFEQKLAALPLTGQRHYLYFQRFPAAAVHSSWFNFRHRYIDRTGSGYVLRLAAESGGDDLLPIVSIASRALNVHLATFEPENRELRSAVARLASRIEAHGTAMER